jgi:small subunit ribosomal protein S24e
MELKILDKKNEPLLYRVNVKAEATFQGATPSKDEFKKQISLSLKADETLVVIKNIRTFFGKEKAQIMAYLYGSKEDMQKVEPIIKKTKVANQEAKKE